MSRSPCIAIMNQKGGVGKTTTAAALGAAAADAGHRVLLVDWDPQASLTRALGGTPNPMLERAVAAYLAGVDAPALTPVVLPGGEHLLPGHIDLAAVELVLVQADAREHVLAGLLAPLLPDYDLVLIDCPPTLGLLAINALVAATAVLIPVTPETLAAEGLLRLLPTLARIQRRLNRELRVLGAVPTMTQRTAHHTAVTAQIVTVLADAGVPLLEPAIPRTIKAAEAAGAGVALTRYPGANGVADAYRALLAQILPEA